MKENGIPTDALESGKKKLLIVDDDQDLVDLIKEANVMAGHQDGQHGFDAWESKSFAQTW